MRIQKKILLLLICVMLSCLLTSCYRATAKQADDYDTFREEIKEEYEPIYEFLPELTDKSCIEDMYLYFTRDILDHYYTIYLSCVYSEEDYEKEVERIYQRFSDRELLNIRQENSESFEYESISYSNGYTSTSYIICSYALFDKENSRIVYVKLLEDKFHQKHTKIPEEYLPKELVASTS